MGKIRFGIVGTNNISSWFLKGASEDSRFLASAVCSRSIGRAMEFASAHSIPNCYDSLEKMLESGNVDAVYVATPNSVHASQSILAMQHGKHVLCEKPMASNASEVMKMIEASEKYGVALMEAVKPTLTPNFRFLRSKIEELGTVRRYFGSYCQYSSRYDKFKEGVVLNAFKPELSNGAVMDIGIYTIYPMVVLFGKPDIIKAEGKLLSSGVDGEGTAIMKYKEMDAVVSYSKIADSYVSSEIQGEKAAVEIRGINNFNNLTFHSRSATGSQDWNQNQTNDGFYYETAEFIDIIEKGERESSINSHANSLSTIEIIDEIRRQCGVVFPAD